jgi:hypothetical protein
MGCGAGGEAPAIEPQLSSQTLSDVVAPDTLEAQMPACARLSVHDSGYVVYVVMDRSCARPGSRWVFNLRLRRGSGDDSSDSPLLDMLEGDEIDGIMIPGLGLRRVGLYRSGNWRRIDNNSSWQRRDGAGLLLLNGELFLLGGWLWGPASSEVWKTRDLVHWEYLGDAPWPPRHGAGWLVHRERLYVVGGDWLRDTWSSADGIRWVLHTADAPFGTLYTPNVVSFSGKILLYGGQGGTEGVNSVWESVDGAQWRLLQGNAPWTGRGLVHGGAVHEGRIFLVGGGVKAVPPGLDFAETKEEFSDIWSTADGVDWRLEAETLGFAPRTHFSLAMSPFGCYVSDGSVGTQAAVSSDLFHASDCVHFAPVPDFPPLKRRHASSLTYFNGSIVILGGPPADDPGTTVWQYFP